MTGSLQAKNGMYYAVLNFKDKQGNRVQKWLGLNLPTAGNKRKAEMMLQSLLTQYQGYEDIGAQEMLLSRHVQNWIEAVRPKVAVTTYDQYVGMLNKHIRPYFDAKGTTLGNLTAGDLEDYYTCKVFSGLSPNTVIKHHAVIRTALQWAVKHRYIRENVADYADKPSHVRYRGEEPYNVQEIATLLQLTINEPIAVPIFLAAFYGLRRSEALGLRWSAIDLQKNTINISTTVVREKRGDKIETVIRDNTTKSEYSMRTLPLCPYTRNYFTAVWNQQEYQRQICGTSYDKRYEDFVCVDCMGTILQPDYVSQKFAKILEQNGLRKIRFHDLRHSCATIMLYLGYTIKDIQTWLGHSNYNFTADTYIHAGYGRHEQMAASLSEKLGDILPMSLVDPRYP